MSNTNKLPVSAQDKNSRHSSTSLFDSIKQVRQDGSEFWSARDLMPILGYQKWERFSDSIERARIVIKNSGHEPEHHIPGAGKMVNIGSGVQREAEDFHMTRYGCYIVAMNGDIRKPEIAEAQSYFAVQTFIAETSAPQKELTRTELALMVIEAEKEKAALEATIQEQAPAVRFAKAVSKSVDSVSVADFSKAIGSGEIRFFQWLRDNGYIFKEGKHNKPYQKWIEQGLFKLVENVYTDGNGENHAYFRILITGKGQIRLAAEFHGMVAA